MKSDFSFYNFKTGLMVAQLELNIDSKCGEYSFYCEFRANPFLPLKVCNENEALIYDCFHEFERSLRFDKGIMDKGYRSIDITRGYRSTYPWLFYGDFWTRSKYKYPISVDEIFEYYDALESAVIAGLVFDQANLIENQPFLLF